MIVTGTAQKQAWIARTLPPIEQIAPLVWCVPVPYRGSPIRHTFAYLVLNDVGDCVVIDPGWDSSQGWEMLTTGLELAGSSVESVIGVVATHYHLDHVAMAARVRDASGSWFGMHENEEKDSARDQTEAERVASDLPWQMQAGVPAEVTRRLGLPESMFASIKAAALPDVGFVQGDVMPLAGRCLHVIATPGHTAGHIAIADEDNGLIFTGDHVLPRITPNVALLHLGGKRSPLDEYYRSLELMHRWDAFEVCPAHEYRFRGLSERVRELRRHHEERSDEILETVRAGATTVWRVAERISWSRGWASLDGVNLRAALSETIAHVEHLHREGRLRYGSCAEETWTLHA